jgi:predicted anti-sigma-YlaC factor YlaD
MDCKKAERFLLLSLDGKLAPEEETLLQGHLESCPSCRRKGEEYRMILRLVRPQTVPEPLPYFRERLLARLKEKEKTAPALLWVKWAHRAVALSLAAFFFFGAGILLFQPQEPRQLSQTERFLLQDENPLGEAASILDQKKAEDRNMMLIFASVGDRDVSRRYRP